MKKLICKNCKKEARICDYSKCQRTLKNKDEIYCQRNVLSPNFHFCSMYCAFKFNNIKDSKVVEK